VNYRHTHELPQPGWGLPRTSKTLNPIDGNLDPRFHLATDRLAVLTLADASVVG